MRQFISILFIIVATLGIFINHAEAKRFGGGRSFGYQRSFSNYSRPTAAPVAPGQARPGSKWLGALTGLAAGGLLAYLLMGHGLGSGLLSWLAVAGIGFLIWTFIRNKLQPTPTLSHKHFAQSPISEHTQITPAQSSATVYPAGFEPENFLREAKVQFIRMQAAYDTKNLVDLREFTAPEIYAEIQLQLEERGDKPNHTEVSELQAELLDVNIESQATVASVRFAGSIREELNGQADPFAEIWHFRKYTTHPTWVIAGIQQQ
jgi:predicted lipid-binding transport protein (Tim44 family)